MPKPRENPAISVGEAYSCDWNMGATLQCLAILVVIVALFSQCPSTSDSHPIQSSAGKDSRGTQFKFIDKPAVKFYNDHTHLLTFTVPGKRHLKEETSRDRKGSFYTFEHLSSIKRFWMNVDNKKYKLSKLSGSEHEYTNFSDTPNKDIKPQTGIY